MLGTILISLKWRKNSILPSWTGGLWPQEIRKDFTSILCPKFLLSPLFTHYFDNHKYLGAQTLFIHEKSPDFLFWNAPSMAQDSIHNQKSEVYSNFELQITWKVSRLKIVWGVLLYWLCTSEFRKDVNISNNKSP